MSSPFFVRIPLFVEEGICLTGVNFRILTEPSFELVIIDVLSEVIARFVSERL